MKILTHVPTNLREGGSWVRRSLRSVPSDLSEEEFGRTWCAIAYLFPGLHPDGFDDAESGWPSALHRFAAEAWRRTDAGEMPQELLYPSDAQWAGIYDRMSVTTAEEDRRRTAMHEDAR